tara:strand:- start:55 stop:186 length:132 start_codon:yes stop_codon:yes gene_type:complete
MHGDIDIKITMDELNVHMHGDIDIKIIMDELNACGYFGIGVSV